MSLVAGVQAKLIRRCHHLAAGRTRARIPQRNEGFFEIFVFNPKGEDMRIGVASDHGGFALKEALVQQLREAGHEVVEFGAYQLNESDDYPDYVIPLAQAVAAQEVERGVAICGSGVGASVCANKIPGVRAALIHDHFSARQGVEDDHMNILCMGGRTVGPAVAWDLVQTYLLAEFSQEQRHLRRLAKIASIEKQNNNAKTIGKKL